MRSWNELRPGVRPWVIAHRGDSAHRPENTMAAFEAAIGAGADAIELDVRLSADGVAVVFHDECLDRTTDGEGPVEAHALRALRRLDAGAWFSDAFAGERIPTLEEVLVAFGRRVALDVELKAEDAAGSEAVAAETSRLLGERGLATDVLLSSFSATALTVARRRLPTTPLALLCEPETEVAWIRAVARDLSAAGIGLDVGAASAPTLDLLHEAGLPVLVFTVDEEAAMRKLLARGADGLFANEVARLRAVIGGEA